MIVPFARLLRIALAFFALAHLARAELSVRFLAESLPAGTSEVVMTSGETISDPFAPPTRFFTEPMKPPARAFEIREAKDRRLLGKIALPEEGDKFIILLLPEENGELRGILLRSDQPGFRPGDNYLFNRTRQGIVGHIGSTRFRMKPGTGGIVRPTGPADEGFHQVGFGVEDEEGPRPLSMTRWPVDSKVRSYVFFFVNPRTGRVDYRAVDEFVPAGKPE